MKLVFAVALLPSLFAADHSGTVQFAKQAVPGAVVTLTRGEQSFRAITDAQGVYRFENLTEGTWTAKVEMQLFAVETKEIAIPSVPIFWDLKALPVETLGPLTKAKQPFERTEATVSQKKKSEEKQQAAPVSEDLAMKAADGFLVNGTVNNGASSPFALLPAFGNNRRGQRSLYNGNLGLILNNSNFDARNYSLTGQATPKPAYNRMQALFSFGGPVQIPGLLSKRKGPNFTVNYQWTRNSNATIATALMPTAEQRTFAGISPQARALLDLYPLPNFSGGTRFNYQIPIVNGLHQDELQTRASKMVKKNFFSSNYAWQSTRTDTPDVFGFLDLGRVSGVNAGFNYRRSFNQRTFANFGVTLSRLRNELTPFFSQQRNVSAEAGIRGGNQEAINWGPPTLIFANGLATLDSRQASLIRNQTAGFSADTFLNRGRHNMTFGYSLKRQQFNVLSQQDARGTFVFTGADDFTKFLRGTPDTVSIAFGNADKYLRGSIHESFANDDFRVNPSLTLNYGVRWEYWTPMEEKYGRLVNLAGVTPVVGKGLIQPDRNNLSPRIGFSWRPLPASSMVIRGGYGIYYDTSVYQNIAMQMAQQAPLSRNLRISAPGLTLADGLLATATGAGASTTFAVDPRFRIGYSQNWQLSIQRDLPAALQIVATYMGGKGTRAQQQILPNTFPAGIESSEPSGYTFLMSNGNSSRHAGQLQVRRRLRNGFTASLNYTYAKSIDNATLGGRGTMIAQDWRDLRAERGRSNFDQRHLVTTTVQYTTGMKALATGWRARFLKDWTFGTQTTWGTGLPLTPIFLRPVRGTGVTGSIRPDYTGAPLFVDGLLNPAAYAAPAAGRWGNAGRNTITGPKQFVLNASMSRTFRSSEKISYDFRIDAANALNYVTFPSWTTVVGNTQFGLPSVANPMRTIQTVFRMRF
jgi:trimeric autotransporter adhesin